MGRPLTDLRPKNSLRKPSRPSPPPLLQLSTALLHASRAICQADGAPPQHRRELLARAQLLVSHATSGLQADQDANALHSVAPDMPNAPTVPLPPRRRRQDRLDLGVADLPHSSSPPSLYRSTVSSPPRGGQDALSLPPRLSRGAILPQSGETTGVVPSPLLLSWLNDATQSVAASASTPAPVPVAGVSPAPVAGDTDA